MTCQICNGAGWVGKNVPVGHPDFDKIFPCECIVADLEARRLARVLGGSGIPPDQQGKTFDAFEPGQAVALPEPRGDGHYSERIQARRWRLSQANGDLIEHMGRAKARCMSYAEAPQDFLVLLGEPGCGKTHLAAAIANYRMAKGDAVHFAVIPDLLDSLRATFSKNGQGASYDDVLSAYKSCSLLVLDDLGTEHMTDWASEKLYQIVNYRYNWRLSTVVTTNEVPHRLDPRLQSRLFDRRNTVFEILAGDYRSRKG